MRAAAQHHHALAAVIRALSAEKSPACLLDSQGTFLFVNEAWDRQALENGGGPGCQGEAIIGTPWLEHIQGEEVQRLHAELLDRALHPRGQPRPIIQVGELNTSTTAALLSTRLEPVVQAGAVLAVAIVHTVVRERPVEEVYDVVHRHADDYRDADGKLTQCACCRRLRDPAEAERWDLVPELMGAPLPSAQTLCELCAELHYGGVEHIR